MEKEQVKESKVKWYVLLLLLLGLCLGGYWVAKKASHAPVEPPAEVPPMGEPFSNEDMPEEIYEAPEYVSPPIDIQEKALEQVGKQKVSVPKITKKKIAKIAEPSIEQEAVVDQVVIVEKSCTAGYGNICGCGGYGGACGRSGYGGNF